MKWLEAWLTWRVVICIVAQTAANYFLCASCGRVCLQTHADHLPFVTRCYSDVNVKYFMTLNVFLILIFVATDLFGLLITYEIMDSSISQNREPVSSVVQI